MPNPSQEPPAPSKPIDHIKIRINMPNPSQEPPASSKTPNQDLKDTNVLCTLETKIEDQNLEHGCTYHSPLPYPNKDEYAKPQSENSSILNNLKLGHKGHGQSLHLQNQDRDPKF